MKQLKHKNYSSRKPEISQQQSEAVMFVKWNSPAQYDWAVL